MALDCGLIWCASLLSFVITSFVIWLVSSFGSIFWRLLKRLSSVSLDASVIAYLFGILIGSRLLVCSSDAVRKNGTCSNFNSEKMFIIFNMLVFSTVGLFSPWNNPWILCHFIIRCSAIHFSPIEAFPLFESPWLLFNQYSSRIYSWFSVIVPENIQD